MHENMVNTEFMIVITVGGMEGSRIGEGNQKDLRCIQLSLGILGAWLQDSPMDTECPLWMFLCFFLI